MIRLPRRRLPEPLRCRAWRCPTAAGRDHLLCERHRTEALNAKETP